MSKIRLKNTNVGLDYPTCRPSLDLDFTQEKLDPRITFTRASKGTRVNKNRQIELVSENQPRFDYHPITGECLGLLIESSSENLLTYSSDLSSFGGTNYTLTQNATTAPDGTNTAISMRGDPGFSVKYIYNQIGTTTTGVYTTSIFAKYNEEQYIVLRVNDQTGVNDAQQQFDILNGVKVGSASNSGTATNASSTITPYANGWYRLSVTGTFNDAVTAIQGGGVFLLFYGAITSTSAVYLWGPQLERTNSPTSYIPTTTSSVTRSSDLTSMEGTNFSSWYNTREGTFIVNNICRVSGSSNYIEQNNSMFSVSNPDKSSQMNAWYNYYGAALVEVDIYSTSAFIPGSNVPVGRNYIPIRQSVSYKNLDFNVVTNGSICTNDLWPQVPDLLPTDFTRLLIGYGEFYTGPLNGTISRLTYYPKKLRTNQLVLLTS